jgi:hypothetical protein
MGHTHWVGAVCLHHIDLIVTIPVRDDDDTRAIRRSSAADVVRGVVGQPNLLGTVGVHDIDSVEPSGSHRRSKGNLFPELVSPAPALSGQVVCPQEPVARWAVARQKGSRDTH